MQKTFEKPFRAENAKQFSEALTTLNNKIDAIKKNITYLDIYNIVDTVTQKERLASQINALAPNSSLIINTEPFYLNDVSYNTGDIILKNSKGEIIHINAQPGGIYFPSKITATTINNVINYNLEYTYDAAAPIDEETTFNVSDPSANTDFKKAKRITFTNLTGADPKDSYIYGLWRKFNDGTNNGTFPAYTYDDKTIQPYIKFYLVDQENNSVEEIVLEYTLTLNTNIWTIGDIDDSIKNNLWIKVK